MKNLLIIIAFLIVELGFAQLTIKKSTIASGGNTATQGNITVVSNIGEVAVQEQSNSTISISEGFIAPDIMALLGVSNTAILTGILIYPNPTIDYIKVNFSETSNYQLGIYDLQGKLIRSEAVRDADEKTLNLKAVAAGTYLLVVKKGTKHKVFKIIKS